jgi:hypothetical protein
VQRAAQLHGATIELLDAPSGRGLRVRVAIPASPATRPTHGAGDVAEVQE